VYHWACVAILHGETILMIRYRSSECEHWTLPGGVEPGETPEQAALREVAEDVCVRGTVVRRL